MALVRSRDITLNSVGEETKKSLNLSVSSINELINSMSTSSGTGDYDNYDDDEVFAHKSEVKDVLGKAFGGSKAGSGSGLGPAGSDISDNAMRALFAKRAARTIHGSLKQRMKSKFVYIDLDLFIF